MIKAEVQFGSFIEVMVQTIGQYNLQIIFRLKNKPRCDEKKCWYCVDWNVEVNRRELWDHKAELGNNRWNVIFNGRKLMDIAKDKKVFRTMQNYRIENEEKDEKKQKKYRKKFKKKYEKEIKQKRMTNDAIEMTNDDIEKIIGEKIEEKIEEKIGERLVKLMHHDDHGMKKRLLRPLVLFCSTEADEQPKGSYPYLLSWKKQIKDIISCQSFVVVEAIVLSNPVKIKKRNSKFDELRDITYVLLGDDTGVIVLIQDDEKFGNRLNNLKMDDRVRITAAEGDKVFYDIDGIGGILKSREVDLYVKESTWVKNCSVT